ncbi:hypothetical protein NOVOSPHI9U_50446 [Novosphingobium sp. 9U]|nr:hypothetical protein NOVOSPHI9U_50446 [Novosphingobium sp. 9U]
MMPRTGWSSRRNADRWRVNDTANVSALPAPAVYRTMLSQAPVLGHITNMVQNVKLNLT